MARLPSHRKFCLLSHSTTRTLSLQAHGNGLRKVSMPLNLRQPSLFSRLLHTSHTGDPFWKATRTWQGVSTEDFLSYEWQLKNSIRTSTQLLDFIATEVEPSTADLPNSSIRTELCKDVQAGMKQAPMSVRLTPYILSLIGWKNPYDDVILRQFIPLASRTKNDHPELKLDSLNETGDSPVRGLVHRYPDKALFLASSVCPVYCRFCTRSYSVGSDTDTVSKKRFLPINKPWNDIFKYIEDTPELRDIVLSGGDSYNLDPETLAYIGNRLLDVPQIKRIRVASKGMAICPGRIIDPDDKWAEALISLSDRGRSIGKHIALHTHFNHSREITWISAAAAQRLFEKGVVVRNQTVLLKGVNNSFEEMRNLIHRLADMNIQPYYVYQGDMIRGNEDLRTPLYEILDLEAQIRGTIAGFMMPSFVVDLPGGGGKRLAGSFESYDRDSGVSIYKAPAIKKLNKRYVYHDPM